MPQTRCLRKVGENSLSLSHSLSHQELSLLMFSTHLKHFFFSSLFFSFTPHRRGIMFPMKGRPHCTIISGRPTKQAHRSQRRCPAFFASPTRTAPIAPPQLLTPEIQRRVAAFAEVDAKKVPQGSLAPGRRKDPCPRHGLLPRIPSPAHPDPPLPRGFHQSLPINASLAIVYRPKWRMLMFPLTHPH